jgi:hypothetical protein
MVFGFIGGVFGLWLAFRMRGVTAGVLLLILLPIGLIRADF